jgi:DNA invertase Pin-like site-specific DNA recombinase
MKSAYEIGVYQRVSTDTQDFQSQRLAINNWLKEHQYRKSQVVWYEDKITGSTLTRRGISRLSADITSGRIRHVVFASIDRFTRELISGLNQIDEWCRAGVRLTFIADGLDVSPPLADAMLKMLLAIKLAMAEAERTRIRERTRLGQLSARARGVRFGRPVTIPASRIKALRRQGITPTQIARECQCSRASVYRALEGASEKSGE